MQDRGSKSVLIAVAGREQSTVYVSLNFSRRHQTDVQRVSASPPQAHSPVALRDSRLRNRARFGRAFRQGG